MGKKAKQAAQAAATQVPAAQAAPATQAVELYNVVAPKRPLTGTRYGQQGNAYTHQQLFAAQQTNNGPLTWAQVQATCAACSHKGFAAYALNRLHVLVPVQTNT